MSAKLSEPLTHDSSIEMLRHLVSLFNSCREDAIDHLTIPELINVYQCWMRCGWYIYPDQWTVKQMSEAKRGICPDWDDDERPLYSKDRRETRKITAITVKERA
jgi:hypothetical protein